MGYLPSVRLRWTLSDSCYSPIKTTKDPVPSDAQSLISCNCKMSSKSPCSSNHFSCRKNGMVHEEAVQDGAIGTGTISNIADKHHSVDEPVQPRSRIG